MIDLQKGAIAAGVGVVDELVTDWDESTTPPRTENFKTAKDLYRLAAVLGGYGLQSFMPRHAALGDTLATAGMPLLVKSVWTTVAAMREPATSGRRYVPRNRGRQPQPQEASSRFPAPTYQHEFAGVRLQ